MRSTFFRAMVGLTMICWGATAENAAAGEQELSQAANDPTASVMSLQFADWSAFDYHNLDGGQDNAIALRAAIPFKTGELSHIFRVTAPIITDSPALESGLSDLTVFDLVVFNESWGRWGVGAVALLPTGGDTRGADQWAMGPAIGFVARPARNVLMGVFNQNLFHVGGGQDMGQRDVNISNFQPILNVGLGSGWSMGLSEMQIVYDWNKARFTRVPIGIQLAKLQRIGRQPVQFSVQYEHNLVHDLVASSDTVRATVKFLIPTQ
jgi:hypothetical protein